MRKYQYEEGVSYYLKQISKIPLLTPEEEKELAIRAKQGDKEALQRLVEGNLRFVINVAKNYVGYGLPFQELISAGNVGLIEAAKRFDPSKNVRFISYAIWWIRQSILQALQTQKGLIRVPQKASSFSLKVEQVYNQLKEDLGREPSYKEIKEELEKQGTEVEEENIKAALLLNKHAVSLDAPVDDEEGSFFIDFLSKHGTKDIEKGIEKEELKKEIEDILNHLNERERYIIERRFGLNGKEPMTLREIGKSLGISRERVRQIEMRALKKIRALGAKRHLRDILN